VIVRTVTKKKSLWPLRFRRLLLDIEVLHGGSGGVLFRMILARLDLLQQLFKVLVGAGPRQSLRQLLTSLTTTSDVGQGELPFSTFPSICLLSSSPFVRSSANFLSRSSWRMSRSAWKSMPDIAD